jgi:antirestriction protein ArdC
MNNNFKPLPEQVSEKMIAEISAGKSIFQRPMNADGTSQFALPLNPSTGKSYKGPTAVILMMQNKQDPRWMTLKQASFNKTPVLKGEKGTLTNFFKNSEFKPVLNDKGEAELQENGKPKLQSVKLEESVLTNAWLYNGSQLKEMPELQVKQAVSSPIERAHQIIEASGVKIEPAGIVRSYSPDSDAILIEDLEEFESPELYYSAVLFELAHATGHESRLDRPLVGETPDSDIGLKEELRATIASIMINAVLDLPFDPREHSGYMSLFASLMKENPGELFKAAADAQKIADFVLKYENGIEAKVESSKPVQQADRFNKGDIILYNDIRYEVLAELKNKVYQMQDLESGQKFKMGPKTGLYPKLLEARNNPQGKVMSAAVEKEAEETLAADEEQDYQMTR